MKKVIENKDNWIYNSGSAVCAEKIKLSGNVIQRF